MSVRKKETIKIDGDAEYTQLLTTTHACDGTEEDAVATITVHHDGYLMGVHLASRMGYTTNGEYYNIELSKSGNYQADTSDNPDTLAVQCTSFQLATQGASIAWSLSMFRTKIFFRSGEKIYLNCKGSDGRTINAYATLFWQDM